MNENFNELKRLFDAEVERIEKSFPTEKWILDYDDEPKNMAAAFTIAMLFDGYTVLNAFQVLKKVRGEIEFAQPISANHIQAKLLSLR